MLTPKSPNNPYMITSPAEFKYCGIVDLSDTTVQVKTKDKFHKLCEEYIDIYAKHSTDIGKSEIVQITLIPKTLNPCIRSHTYHP